MNQRVHRVGAFIELILSAIVMMLILTDNSVRSLLVEAISEWSGSIRLFAAILGGYLIGSIPIGFLVIAAVTGENIQVKGSGRIGTANAFRAGGFLSGFITVVGDFLKGMSAVVLGALLFPNIWAPVLSGLGGVLGHNASIFLAFRGGAGTISNMGAVTAFWPPALLFIAPLFVLGVLVVRIASVASLILNFCVVLLFLALIMFGGYPWPLLVYAVGALLLTMYALRPNIDRLRKGTEPHVPPIRLFKRTQHG